MPFPFMVVVLSAQLVGPDTTQILDRNACPACKVVLQLHTTLGASDPPDLDIPVLSVGRLNSGQFLTTGVGTSRSVSLFAKDGRFEREVGRVGSGPGEFILPFRIALGAADSAFVVDRSSRRISILSGRGSFVRSLTTSQADPSDIVELPNKDFLLTGRSFSKEGAGYSIHLVARNGTGTRPIGEPLLAYDRAHRADLLRVIALAKDSTVWLSHANRYLIERRLPSGRLVQVLERKTSWFTPWLENAPPIEKPPKPGIMRIATDSIGRLWVFLSIASSRFAPLVQGRVLEGSKTNERVPPLIADVFNNYDTLIEILDPITGSLVTSTRVSGFLLPVTPFPFTARIERRPDGLDVVRVYRLAIATAPNRQ